MIVWWLGCTTSPEAPPAAEAEAMILTAPARDGAPAFELSLVAPKGSGDTDLPPTAMFPPLAAAVAPALQKCLAAHPWTKPDPWTWVGELRMDGQGQAYWFPPSGPEPTTACVIDTLNGTPASGLPGIDYTLPASIRLL